jgi:DNA double-strand break repair and V(D)J recombination protein XRCC4
MSQQKLGTITLAEDAEALEKIDLFEWCGLAVTSKNTIAEELASQQKAVHEKGEQVKKLEDALSELEKLKNDHEMDLLEKFSLLLNEKKLKIRDQQRLLASSNVDPATLAAVEETRSVRHHSAGPSRRGKRKAGSTVDSEEGSSDGFENMEVDEAPNESEQDQPQTPPQDDSTADEASDDEAPVPPPSRKSLVESPTETSSSTAAPPPRQAAVPPKRDLPFQNKKKAPAKPAPLLDGSETESDDEL